MRWSIIRVIWARELRDQLRDRRTVFMIAVLPVLLYPVAGFGVLQLATGVLQQRHAVGVQGLDHLPPWPPPDEDFPPLFVKEGERLRVPASYFQSEKQADTLLVRPLDAAEAQAALDGRRVRCAWPAAACRPTSTTPSR